MRSSIERVSRWARRGLPGIVAPFALLVHACGGEFTTSKGSGDAGSGASGADSGVQSGSGGSRGDGGTVSSSGGARAAGGAGGRGAGGATAADGGATGAGGVVSSDGGATGAGGVVSSDGGATGVAGATGSTGGVTTNTGGVTGIAGATSTGGVTSNTGGVTSNTGGVTGTGGVIGAVCTPGALDCDRSRRCSNNGAWQDYICGPAYVTDVTNIDPAKLPGFDVGFRCKSLSVCGAGLTCIYYLALGSVQSSETPQTAYTDGSELDQHVAMMVSINLGAASQCGNPEIGIQAGESVLVAFNDQSLRVYFPEFKGSTLTLYVREDGATFYDAALKNRAQGVP